MKVSKCCGAEIWGALIKIQETSSGYAAYNYRFFCSKCHKPCEAIDLPDERRETMKEPDKNVLLEKLKDWRWAIQHGHTKRRDFRNWHDDDEQAYEQICQLIENQPICIFCALPITGQEGACKKCANRALKDLSHQPEVDIIFIDKWVASIFLSLEHYIQENDSNEANNQLEAHLRELLQDAGVKIREEGND